MKVKLLSPQDEKYCRTVRAVVCSERAPQPVVYAHSSNYSEWNVDKAWSSQEWKSDELRWKIERGDPLIAHNERLNHVLLMTARTSIWKKMKINFEG